MYVGVLALDEGRIIYLRNDIAALEGATDHLRHLLAAARPAKVETS
jgi:hypothetical protein